MESYEFVLSNGKWAIFDGDNQITEWFDCIYSEGLYEGESNYYIASIGMKCAIFDKDNNRISDWYDWIHPNGLVKGQSIYYIVEKDNLTEEDYSIKRDYFCENTKCAIFDKDGNIISEWYDWISDSGLVEGQSEYYIARHNGKETIFDKYGNKISDWFDFIYDYGLVKGESNYYIANRNGKYAIFDKNGNQVSEWHDKIFPEGLVMGNSDTSYIAVDGYYFAVYNINGNIDFEMDLKEHFRDYQIEDPKDRYREVVKYVKKYIDETGILNNN